MFGGGAWLALTFQTLQTCPAPVTISTNVCNVWTFEKMGVRAYVQWMNAPMVWFSRSHFLQSRPKVHSDNHLVSKNIELTVGFVDFWPFGSIFNRFGLTVNAFVRNNNWKQDKRETCSLAICRTDFARRPLILSDKTRFALIFHASVVSRPPKWFPEAGQKLFSNQKNVCLRPQTDFIRLVSSKLMFQGTFRRLGRPLWQLSVEDKKGTLVFRKN